MALYLVKEYSKDSSKSSREWTSTTVYTGYNLRQVLRGVRRNWLPTAPGRNVQIEARNNNVSVWKIAAAALSPNRERVLIHNFHRELRIVRIV